MRRVDLQAALGISASQSYLVAQRNLVVEGADDFMLLTELSNLFIRSGKDALPGRSRPGFRFPGHTCVTKVEAMVDDQEGRLILNFARAVATKRRQEAEQIGLPFDDLIGEAVIGEFDAREQERSHSTMWSVGAYRMQALRNAVADALRRERKHHRRRDHDFFDQEEDPASERPSVIGLSVGMARNDITDALVQSVTLRAVITRLSRLDQHIVELRNAGYAHAEIGRHLHIRKAAVGARLSVIEVRFRNAITQDLASQRDAIERLLRTIDQEDGMTVTRTSSPPGSSNITQRDDVAGGREPSRREQAAARGLTRAALHSRLVSLLRERRQAPALSSLPLITKGPDRGARWMTKRQFAAWCGVSVATVSDWIYTRRIVVSKHGTTKQARVRIASGERERLRPPVVVRSRRKGGDDA